MATFGPLTAAPVNVNAPDFAANFSEVAANTSFVIPEGVAQIGSFAFDAREVEEAVLESEVTDHWLEDNTAAQDHVGVRPITITLSGYVAELNLPASTLKTVLGALTAATNALSQLPVFLGTLTPGGAQLLEQAISQAQSVVVQVEQAVARGEQIAKLLSPGIFGTTRNKQQQAYLLLKSYWQARIVFTVWTPFEVYSNMVIESVRMTQPQETTGWSKIVVRLKQLQFVGDAGQPDYAANLAAPVALAQGQAATNNGPTAGTSGPTVGANLKVPAAP